MLTNDERREVAENLRTMTVYGCRYAEQFYELLKETVMNVEDFHDFGDVADRLADLIEPEERICQMIEQGDAEEYIRWFGCQECHECIPVWGLSKPNYCPNCGAKVVK